MMKQIQKRSRAKAQRRKDFIICRGGVFGKRVLTRTMVFAGLFLLLGVGAVSATQIDPASAPSVTQPSGSPAVSNVQSTGAPTSMGAPDGSRACRAEPDTPQSSAAGPANLGVASAMKDIRDIRGPLHIPDPLAWLIYSAAGFLLLLASAVILEMAQEKKNGTGKIAF